ncbi:MAG: hypothetical protein FWD03_05780, partial [Defluviitaleaceae bacterium]|nr:hypothetical protein [Defluviitaleaceae bacterium]
MKNAVLINAVKVISFILGFFGALSLMRSLSSAFSWYAYIIYGNWFHFGPGLSILSLALCLGLFTYSIWHTKPSNVNPPHRRIDYSLLALACGTGFYAVVHILQNWAGLLGLTMQTAIIVFPIIAYILPMLALWELLIRLHDKTLMPTLYWLAFFKTYPAWQPIGFFAALLLASQLFILIYRFFTLAGWFSFFAVGVITYFAAFLLNLSKEYDKANAKKIQAERFKSELITNVSHDIKTPLTSIINYVDLLK